MKKEAKMKSWLKWTLGIFIYLIIGAFFSLIMTRIFFPTPSDVTAWNVGWIMQFTLFSIIWASLGLAYLLLSKKIKQTWLKIVSIIILIYFIWSIISALIFIF
jgi:Kef-type K+ transport system membrane component KefB